MIPTEVLEELQDGSAPQEVSKWATALPNWVEVQSAPPSADPALELLDPGERGAISLAQLNVDVLLLIDETAGRLEASRRGIPTTGTIGILRAASIAGLVDLPQALTRLTATNFRISRSLLDGLIAEDASRARSGTE